MTLQPDTTRELGEILAALVAQYPEFELLRPGGVLSVPLPPTTVAGIRITLPGADQRLMLSSVALEAVDGATLDTVAVSVTASGWAEGVREVFEPSSIIDPSTTRTVIDTGPGDDPWVELTLTPTVELTGITIRNTDASGTDAARLHDVGILIAGPDGTLADVFDARSRAAELGHTAQTLLEHAVPEADALTRTLLQMLTDTVVGRYPEARAAQRATKGISDERRRGFHTVVNRDLLPARSLEWTAHGPQRSFRYFSHEEKADYIRSAVGVADALNELTPQVCFGFGAALATVRDGDLIPHDDDLDIIIGFEKSEAATLDEALVLVEKCLRPQGYVVDGGNFAFRKVNLPHRMPVDVFVGLFEGDLIAWYPGTRKSLDRDTMFPVSEGVLLGVPCPLPRRPVTYLETVYGPTWREPDPSFKHVFARKRYADLTEAGTTQSAAPPAKVESAIVRLLRRWRRR